MALGAKRKARIEIGADTAELDRDLNSARRKLRRFGGEARKELGIKSFGGKDREKKGARGGLMGGFVGGFAGGLGSQAMGMATGFLSSVADDVFQVEKALTRLQIAGEVADKDMPALRAELLRVSNATGISRAELLKGAAAYTSLTGNALEAQQTLGLFAEVAAGSGVSIDDVATAAAALRKNMKIDPSQMRRALDVLVKQGQMGAVEIKNLAEKLAGVTPQFSGFAGAQTVEGMTELGAMLQVVQDGFNGADEAATGFNGLMTQITRNNKKLAKFKIKVFDANGEKRNLLTILNEIAKTPQLMKGGALLDVLGEEKAVRAAETLIKKMQEVERIKRESTNSDQVAKNNAKWQESTAGKLQRATEQMKNTLAEAFTPERVEAFTKAVLALARGFVELIGYAETFLKTIDLGDGARQLTKQRALDGTEGLSKKELVARAAIWERKAMTMDKDGYGMNQALGYSDAARELRKRANAPDPQGATGVFTDMARAFAQELAKSPVVVQVGATPLAKELDNATHHRQQRKR